MSTHERTYGRLDWDEVSAEWVLEEIEPHVCIRLKALFPRIPKGRGAPFRLPDTPDTALDLEWFLGRYPLVTEDSVRARLVRERRRQEKMVRDSERILLPSYTPRDFEINGALRPYQAQAVDLLLTNKRLLVGDVVGLGKTLIAIGAFTVRETLPALVVVQTHLPKQWEDQVTRFTGARVHRIEGTRPYELPEADVYIIKYSCLAGWSDVYAMRPFRAVVFDEIQELRRSASQKYQAASTLVQSCDYVLGLSATPIYNYVEDVYNILSLIQPGCLGSKEDFFREWAPNGKTVQDPRALGTYLRENYLFLRRTRTDVQREMPPVNKLVHTVGFDEAAVRNVEEIARTLALKTREGSFIERGQAARELDMMVRQNTGVSKARYVAEYVRMLLENDEPVLLAGWHRDVYDIWLRELKGYRPAMYTGSETGKQKDKARERFMSGETNLMIISLRSGVGLDGLQERASVVVFGELDWSPQIHEQVIGRLQRDGQQNQVTAIYLVSDAGADPPMVNLLGLKASQAGGIIDPNAPPGIQYSDESRIQLLAEQYLQGRGG